MAKRMILMLALMFTLVGGLGFAKFRQIKTAVAHGASFQPPPEAVTTIVAKREKWPATLNVIGTTAAVQGVRAEPLLNTTQLSGPEIVWWF